MTREEFRNYVDFLRSEDEISYDVYSGLIDGIDTLEQEPKIKVLDHDEAIRKLAAVDVYASSAWVTLLKDLEYLGLKICEVKNDD